MLRPLSSSACTLYKMASPMPALLALLVLVLSPPPTYSESCALYDDTPTPAGVHCFHGNQLDKAVTSSRFLWMVEFYSSWCGHCQHFAPVMKELGGEVKAWSSVFKIGVMECTGSKDNQKSCDRHQIQAYPTLKVLYNQWYTKVDVNISLALFVPS